MIIDKEYIMCTKWIKTTKDIYISIYNHYFNCLIPYSTYTNPYGNDGLSCIPEIYTSWGFEDGNCEVIACKQTKKNKEQSEWDYEYYLAKSVICEECE